MPNEEDYILDISSSQPQKPANEPNAQSGNTGGDEDTDQRPWISVYFECCRVYQRIYRNKAGTAYTGWCPKCMRKITAEIGPDGTANRFFKAT